MLSEVDSKQHEMTVKLSIQMKHFHNIAMPIIMNLTKKEPCPIKTKMPVRKNDNPTPQEMAWRKAIHLLQDACDDQLVLMHHEGQNVYLIPAIQDNNCGDYKPGTIQYQVSDGLPGIRSNSFNFSNLTEAIEAFNNIVNNGWEDGTRLCKNS